MIKTRRVLSILLAFTIIITILQSVTIPVKAGSEDFEYKKLADGTIEITSYKGSDEDISIPSMIDGYTVSRIGSGAFEYNESIKNITFGLYNPLVFVFFLLFSRYQLLSDRS
jgi:hypothetical protein